MISAIKIGSFEIPVYWLMLTLGTLGMMLCAVNRRERFALKNWQCILFSLLLTVVGVTGAMLLYFLETGTFGGVSFYGSVFLIPLLMPLVGLLFRLRPGQTMDLCGPCVAIMIGCMRFGCFLTGCCGGWTVCLGSLCFEWPTQILDSVGDFAIMTWLLQTEDQTPGSGRLYPWFMVTYSAMRFCLEFLRDTPKDWLHLSHGQWFAAGAVVMGLLWLALQKRQTKQTTV